jgi:hypothetical protein
MLSEMSESKLAHKNCLEMIGRKLTVAECESHVRLLLFAIAQLHGERAARSLFKKYARETSAKARRDVRLLTLYFEMETPKKLTLAKRLDPDNHQKILQQLKRALKDRRYKEIRKDFKLLGRLRLWSKAGNAFTDDAGRYFTIGVGQVFDKTVPGQ